MPCSDAEVEHAEAAEAVGAQRPRVTGRPTGASRSTRRSGRWFVIDEQQLDDLGLARTLGPFDTLDEAKAAADEQRSTPASESPLAELLAVAARTKLTVVRGGRATDEATEARAPKPKPTWIDASGADARRARAYLGASRSSACQRPGAREARHRRRAAGGRTAVLARALNREALAAPEGRELARAPPASRRPAHPRTTFVPMPAWWRKTWSSACWRSSAHASGTRMPSRLPGGGSSRVTGRDQRPPPDPLGRRGDPAGD